MRRTRTYRKWSGMKTRCTNKNETCYKYYGGRGISFCERWKVYANFLADMGEAPDKMTLERIDSNKDYGPENCRWATMKEQANNKSNNVFVTYNGETKTIAQWSDITGIKQATIAARVRSGSTVEEILGHKKIIRENPTRRRIVTINGVTRSFIDWCNMAGIKKTTAHQRLGAYGWSLEKTFNFHGGKDNDGTTCSQ